MYEVSAGVVSTRHPPEEERRRLVVVVAVENLDSPGQPQPQTQPGSGGFLGPRMYVCMYSSIDLFLSDQSHPDAARPPGPACFAVWVRTSHEPV